MAIESKIIWIRTIDKLLNEKMPREEILKFLINFRINVILASSKYLFQFRLI